MVQKLGIQQNKVFQLNQELYKNYGTSMAGLKVLLHMFSNFLFEKSTTFILKLD